MLYLCLEDSYSRIQNRLLDITDDAPPNLFFATMSEKLQSGLEQQIERFLAAHPDTVLIVIDTLQRIRGGVNDANPYASDYRDLGILKELADKHRIAILLIHHLRKMNDDDPMNMISGTTKISGATDTNFVLRKSRRSSNSATLYCTGRDIEYRELLLEFDGTEHIWKLTEDSVDQPARPQEELVFFLSEFLNQRRCFTGTATELAGELDEFAGEQYKPNVLVKKLLRCQQELLDCLLDLDQDVLMDAQEVAVIDQLLEYIEVSVRTTCDLIRFKCMNTAQGIPGVQSVERPGTMPAEPMHGRKHGQVFLRQHSRRIVNGQELPLYFRKDPDHLYAPLNLNNILLDIYYSFSGFQQFLCLPLAICLFSHGA